MPSYFFWRHIMLDAFSAIERTLATGQPFIDRIATLNQGVTIESLDDSIEGIEKIESLSSEILDRLGDVSLNSANLISRFFKATYVGVLGKVGHDRWDALRQQWCSKELKCKMIVKEKEKTGVIACVREALALKETMIRAPEASVKLTFDAFIEKYGKTIDHKTLVLLPAFTIQFENHFFDKALAHFNENKAVISCNLGAKGFIDGHRDKLLETLPRIQHISCNLEEACALINNEAATPEQALRAMASIAPDSIIVITNGPQGAWGYQKMDEKETFLHVPAVEYVGKVVNTLGAGDNFQAMFLVAYIKLAGKEDRLKRSLELANQAAVHLLSVPNAQFPEKDWNNFSSYLNRALTG